MCCASGACVLLRVCCWCCACGLNARVGVVRVMRIGACVHGCVCTTPGQSDQLPGFAGRSCQDAARSGLVRRAVSPPPAGLFPELWASSPGCGLSLQPRARPWVPSSPTHQGHPGRERLPLLAGLPDDNGFSPVERPQPHLPPG